MTADRVDLDRVVSPFRPICDPLVDGLIVERGDDHMTVGFGRSLLDPVDQSLTDQGAAP